MAAPDVDLAAVEDVEKFEAIYNCQVVTGKASAESKFNYAWCLVRSKYRNDIKKGIQLLEGWLALIFRKNHVLLVSFSRWLAASSNFTQNWLHRMEASEIFSTTFALDTFASTNWRRQKNTTNCFWARSQTIGKLCR
eukprot:Sdes_comp20500_c0_seq5m14962